MPAGTTPERAADALAEALEAHGYDDWYVALLCAALDEGLPLPEAAALAAEAYKKRPGGPRETPAAAP